MGENEAWALFGSFFEYKALNQSFNAAFYFLR